MPIKFDRPESRNADREQNAVDSVLLLYVLGRLLKPNFTLLEAWQLDRKTSWHTYSQPPNNNQMLEKVFLMNKSKTSRIAAIAELNTLQSLSAGITRMVNRDSAGVAPNALVLTAGEPFDFEKYNIFLGKADLTEELIISTIQNYGKTFTIKTMDKEVDYTLSLKLIHDMLIQHDFSGNTSPDPIIYAKLGKNMSRGAGEVYKKIEGLLDKASQQDDFYIDHDTFSTISAEIKAILSDRKEVVRASTMLSMFKSPSSRDPGIVQLYQNIESILDRGRPKEELSEQLSM